MDMWETLVDNSLPITGDAYTLMNNPKKGVDQVVDSLEAKLSEDHLESQIFSSLSGVIHTDNISGIIRPDKELVGTINQDLKGDVEWKR